MSGTSIDPGEVAYYTRLAHAWWDAESPFWPLHRLNEVRVAWLRERIAGRLGGGTAGAPLAGVRVLDIGCGGGILSESMARLGAAVTGIDVVEKNIRVAALHAGEGGLAVDYRLQTAEALAAEGARYDVVLNMEVVEHVADLAGFMAACCALVRPGGLMAVATLNRTPASWLFAIVGAEYILRWLPRGTHRWRRFVKPAEAERLLAAGGLGVIDRSGVRVNPFTRSLHLTGRLGVNYMVLAEKAA
ncbi:MAG: bifunctional 2-polyprenyl-6-hydroxyphenol methylase/3-demethylubiquinol 3-O-methyltransferase UbiG [Gammaproteobacteria bacterium]|nr:bifunctional 2-polyprenyl-6-hydroxyphenol methylase/3-demethylubiquinol 3-O-methyltransferase UbiG [Gammaproteobacteria bacterium]